MSISELTPEKWEAILQEAFDCLDVGKNHRGRAEQEVTLIKSGEKITREVTPHLTISVPLWIIGPPSLEFATDIIRKKMDYMRPMYDYLIGSIAKQ